MKLSDYIVAFLQKKGIRHFFGYQGTMIAHVVDSIERNPETENHSSYNEQGAAFAACGYAQAKEECACAYATSGPGAVNLLSGVADAYYDSLPVIFLTGQLNTYEYSGIEGLRQQGFQETDIVAMAKPVTKYAVQIRNPEDIVVELNKAYHIATTGRKGPVLIDLPMNIQRSEVENPVYDMTFEDKHTDTAVVRQAADTILEALEHAKRPMIMLGHGVDSHAAQQELISFAQKRQIPIITSVLAKSVLGYDNPLNFGCIGGAYGHRYANMIANAKSDLLLCFGISLCTRQIGTKVYEFAKNAKIIQIDVDPAEINKNILVDCSIIGDVREVLKRLNARIEEHRHDEWDEEIKELKKKYPLKYDHSVLTGPYIMEEINRQTKGDAIIVTEVGQHQMWAAQYYKYLKPRRLLTSGGLGTMGYGLGASLGAKMGCPDKTVINIAGDGCFRMNMNELATAARYNIPVIEVVINNHVLGMVRQWQTLFYGERYSQTILDDSVDFVKLAEALGVEACRVTKPEEFGPALAHAVSLGKPYLIDCMIGSDDKVFPMVPAGKPIETVFDQDDLDK